MREFISNTWPSIVAIVGFLAGTIAVIQFIRELGRWLKEWNVRRLGEGDTPMDASQRQPQKNSTRGTVPVQPKRIRRLLVWSIVIMAVVVVFFFLSLFLHSSLLESRGKLDGLKEAIARGDPKSLIQLEQQLHRMSIVNAERDSLLVADSAALVVKNTAVHAYYASVDSLNRLLVSEASLSRETGALANWCERFSGIAVLFRKANDTLRTARDTLEWAVQRATNRVRTLESLVRSVRETTAFTTGPIVSQQMIEALKATPLPKWVTGHMRIYKAVAKDMPVQVFQQLLQRHEYVTRLNLEKLHYVATRVLSDMGTVAELPTVKASAGDSVRAHKDDIVWQIDARIRFNVSFNESLRNHLASLDSITRSYEEDIRLVRDSVALREGIVGRLEIERDSIRGQLESLQDSLKNLAAAHDAAIDDYERLVSEYNQNNQSQFSLMETLNELLIERQHERLHEH